MECLLNPLDLFHFSIWKTAHRKRFEDLEVDRIIFFFHLAHSFNVYHCFPDVKVPFDFSLWRAALRPGFQPDSN